MKGNVFFVLVLLIFISTILITILHELGHALLATLFSKKEVNVYLGSYGNKEGSITFKIGHCRFNVKKNIFKWHGGLCINGGEMTLYQNVLYILAGALFPFLTGIAMLFLSITYGGEYFYGFSFVFLVLSTLSLIYNLYPKRGAIVKEGNLSPNDGYLLVRLFRYKKYYPEYINAVNLYNCKKYEEASLESAKLLEKGLDGEDIIRLGISSAMLSKNMDIAKKIIEGYSNLIEPETNDHINIGYYYSSKEQPEKAMEHYTKALKKEESWHALNNIGYQLNLAGEYAEAISYFNKALAINNHAYTYNNRGLAKIKLGQYEEGLKDLKEGNKLDPNNSYYYKNMGTYYFDNNQFEKALQLFEKAKEMDDSTYKIDEDIERTRKLL